MFTKQTEDNYLTWRKKISNLRNIFPTIYASNRDLNSNIIASSADNVANDAAASNNVSKSSKVNDKSTQIQSLGNNSSSNTTVATTSTSANTSTTGACSTNDDGGGSDDGNKLKTEEMKLLHDDVDEYIRKETGLNRLKDIFFDHPPDKPSQEVVLSMQTAMNTGMIVFVFTSAFGAQAAGEKFIAKHQHRTFTTKFDAIRTYRDAMMFGSIRFGLRFGVWAGTFAGMFMLISQSIAAYRNKSSLWEYIAAGGFTCGFLRSTHGWRGIVVGGIFGLGFGLFGGLATLSLLKFTNYTQEERHYEQVLEKCKEIRDLAKLQNGDNVDLTLTQQDNII